MSTEDKDLDNIKVQEELDGGAVVELPDHLATNNDDDDDDQQRPAIGHQVFHGRLSFSQNHHPR